MRKSFLLESFNDLVRPEMSYLGCSTTDGEVLVAQPPRGAVGWCVVDLLSERGAVW